MPLIRVLYYWVTCDRCGANALDGDGYHCAMVDEDAAVEQAEGRGWRSRSDWGAFACPSCEGFCESPGCLNDAGPGGHCQTVEADYESASCWSCCRCQPPQPPAEDDHTEPPF